MFQTEDGVLSVSLYNDAKLIRKIRYESDLSFTRLEYSAP